MNIVRVLELAIVALVVILFITQITVPLIQNRRLFPLFRREAKLLSELEEIQQEAVERVLERQIKQEREGLNQPIDKDGTK